MSTIRDFARNLKFRHKLTISYIVIIIIPITILGLYSFAQAKSYLLTDARRQLSYLVHEAALDIDYKFQLYNKTISHVTYNNQVSQIVFHDELDYFYLYVSCRDVLDPLFTTILTLNEDFRKLLIYTSNPHIPRRAETFTPLVELSRVPAYFDAVERRGVNWTTMDGALVGFFRFIAPHRTSPTNFLVVEMKRENVFAPTRINTIPYAVVIEDEESNTIYSLNNLPSPLLDNFERVIPRIERAEIQIDGSNLLLFHAEIPETGWTLHYATPANFYVVSSYRILTSTGLIVVLCIVGLFLLSLLFSRTFVRRVDSLNLVMKDVVEGNRHVEIRSSSGDEIGELTNRFADMLDSINTLIDEVYNDRIVLREAELKALQAQITPHFLYNSLSLVNGMAIQSGEVEIGRLARNISRFYRTVLNGGRNITTVHSEIANTKTYINIQSVMHDDSFDVEYDLDPEIFGHKMVNCVLQPLVENAIEHGIDQDRDGRGCIRISGCLDAEERLIFTIQNTGPRVSSERFEEILQTDSLRYGLKNVHERIKIMCGEAFGVRMDDDESWGFTVHVELPLDVGEKMPRQA